MSTPRFLNLLRIEDERFKPPNLPLQDMGRIARWSDFVLGIASGKLRTLDHHMTVVDWDLATLPDILTVDFRFGSDDSTPDPSVPMQPSGVSFSEGLKQRNNGVVMGSHLMSLAGQKDMPTATALHTLYPADTQRDAVTVLLVGQMLAATGRHFENHEPPFEAACRYFDSLPRNLEDAVKQCVGQYRITLLTRLGVDVSDKDREAIGGPDSQGVDDRRLRLFCPPGSGLDLKNRIAAATSDEELDSVLSKHGLTVWDRFGKDRCIDLRSLFLDVLDASQLKQCENKELRKRTWGILPRSLFEKGAGGHRFLTLVENAEAVYSEAAAIVRHNSLNGPTLKLARKSPLVKFVAMCFAYAEERLRSSWELEDLFDTKWWDTEKDSVTEDPDFQVTLREVLESVLDAIRSIPRLFPDDNQANNVWVPLTANDGPSICRALLKYYQDADKANRRTDIILEIFCYANLDKTERNQIGSRAVENDFDDTILSCQAGGEPDQTSARTRRSRAVRNVIRKLVLVGVLEEKAETRTLYRVVPNAKLRADVVSRVDRIKVAELLGFSNFQIRNGTPSLNNQLNDICKNAGYDDNYLELLDRLDRCDFPNHVRAAVEWYECHHEGLAIE